ncbi:heterokaryon incompatibility protein-domain-containing protein [Schizothecium vesticola]|uniref:Heterokaryon incompatibility protein-domain-containing protein n=1 Tax=Schizothecium vesticola TaxID=314040 RepID=A0AA40K8P6_9PEZI|nr:heterokaryon incompatibility protein-domain-containing protein [Schizothecium vesticola]
MASADPAQRDSARRSVPPPKQRTSRPRNRQYRYEELEESCIRLINLLPEKKTMIQCEMMHVSMNDLPRYMAISYAWGDARDTKNIELEDAIIPISTSLHGALQALRHSSRPVLVWADAMCINQENHDERTEQVALMTRIYAEADAVALWLGPEEDDSSSAISLLHSLHNREYNQETPDEVERLIVSEATKPQGGRFGAVVDLFERDYWRRLWVIQEVMNARSVTIYCGATKMRWSTLQNAVAFFSTHKDLLDQYFPVELGHPYRFVSPKTSMSCSGVLSGGGPRLLLDIERALIKKREYLLDVLLLSRHQLASDPKDKFFGLLGILPEHIQRDFRADYAMSVKEIFTGIVDYLIKTTGSLDVVCEAFNTPQNNPNGLPSFVPDWSRPPISSYCSARDSGRSRYDAALGRKAECRFLDEQLCLLEISAVYIGKVWCRGMCGAAGIIYPKDFLATFLQWRAILLDASSTWSDKSRHLAEVEFAQTLCLGEVGVPKKWRDDPEEWLRVCYTAFASEIQRCLPNFVIDFRLRKFLKSNTTLGEEDWCWIVSHVLTFMRGRSLCITEDGHIGSGSEAIMEGDIVVVPLGCSTPFILRPHGNRGNYHFIGDLYLHGYMGGEAVLELNKGRRELKKYVLR